MNSTTMFLLVGGLVGGIVLRMFLIFGLPPLLRLLVRWTGEPARPTDAFP